MITSLGTNGPLSLSFKISDADVTLDFGNGQRTSTCMTTWVSLHIIIITMQCFQELNETVLQKRPNTTILGPGNTSYIFPYTPVSRSIMYMTMSMILIIVNTNVSQEKTKQQLHFNTLTVMWLDMLGQGHEDWYESILVKAIVIEGLEIWLRKLQC